MEVLATASAASLSPRPSNKINICTAKATTLQVLPWKYFPTRTAEAPLRSPIMSRRTNTGNMPRNCGNTDGASKHNFICQSIWRLNKNLSSKCALFSVSDGCLLKLKKYSGSVHKVMNFSEKIRQQSSVLFVPLVIGVMLVMSVSVSVSKSPSWALTEENLLFLEAWRTIDRAYVDKSFNGQSWFRYREDALRNEPMNTREQTCLATKAICSGPLLVASTSNALFSGSYYNIAKAISFAQNAGISKLGAFLFMDKYDMAIRKMLATLDDPFTRFLEPEKFKSLRSGTQGALTGVGLSIGYPTHFDGSAAGLVVISAAPGGPANRAGVLAGDLILAIDDTSTETMGIYDAAERLQGPDGTLVELTIRSGPEIKHIALTRERVSLNPVKSRLCKLPGSGNDSPRIGYIKLTSFNQNASGAVKEAIDSLRSNSVNAFVLDLRDNSGGLFPEGIEIAKIWLDKGVIVYICDSRGVRDIYDTDGSSAIAASEPLAVLVNKGTASASEILAGALKDNKRALLFGEPTYGKGKIQSVFQLSDGSGLAVTVARYETPAHTDIDKVGVIPDHPLPTSFPKDEEGFCSCLQDPATACYVNRTQLFAR